MTLALQQLISCVIRSDTQMLALTDEKISIRYTEKEQSKNALSCLDWKDWILRYIKTDLLIFKQTKNRNPSVVIR
jgi:hypothetical protein